MPVLREEAVASRAVTAQVVCPICRQNTVEDVSWQKYVGIFGIQSLFLANQVVQSTEIAPSMRATQSSGI